MKAWGSISRPAVLLGALLTACGGGAAAPASSVPAAAPASSSAPAAASASSAGAKPSAVSTSAPASAGPASGSAPSGSAPASPASSAAATKPSPAASGATTIQFGTIPSINSEVYYLPTDIGEMAAKGLDVKFTTVTSTPQTLVAVAGGKLDMGVSSISAAFLNAFVRGTDLKVVASAGVEAPGHAAFLPVLARSDLYDSGQLKTAAQLKGKKVALNCTACGIEYDLYEVLKPAGLKVSDVDLVTMPWPDMIVALGNKSIDAGLIAQPLATQAVAKGVAKILADDYAAGQQNAVIVANSKFLQQHGDAAATFLEVMLKTGRQLNGGKIKTDPQALASIQKWTKIPADVVKGAPDPYWVPNGQINRASIGQQQAYFIANKEVDYTQPLNVDSIIDQTALNQAVKQLGS